MILPNDDDDQNHSQHDCHNYCYKVIDFLLKQGETGVWCARELGKLKFEVSRVLDIISRHLLDQRLNGRQ